MSKRRPAPRVAPPDLGFAVRDLQRTFLRVADNLRWYEQEWLGVPIWQLPDDLIALQRIVQDLQPKWIVETGTKFGGSAIFFASLLALMGRRPGDGGVITVDVQAYAEAERFLVQKPHRLAPFVRQRLVGDAKSPRIVASIRRQLAAEPGRILVFLDDWHDGEHVHAELRAYSAFLKPGDMLIVADTTFEDLADTPIVAPSKKYPDARRSNPRVALRRFLAKRKDFVVVPGYAETGISNFPDSVLRRVKPR
jgi:cephalosporin hydroxylase